MNLDKYSDPEYLENEIEGKKANDKGDEVEDYLGDGAEKSFKVWLKRTVKGENTPGQIIGGALDIAGFILPDKGIINRIRSRFQSQSNGKPMLKKVLSIRNFINLKDEQGNFSWSELGASLLQIAIAGAIVYGAVQLGIWEQLSSFLGAE